MQINVTHRPAMSLAQVRLEQGESITAESGAMVGMSANLDMATGMQGGLAKGLMRKFGGESFFQNTFTAQGGPGEILLAHSLPGDIVSLPVPQSGLFIQSTSYIAAARGVHVATEFGGFKNWFGGEGLFVLRATASGVDLPVIIGAFGGIYEIACRGNLVIDCGHLVAWDTTLQHTMSKSASGFVASFLSGEGMGFEFSGEGRIWLQTRNPGAYGRAIGRLLTPRQQ